MSTITNAPLSSPRGSGRIPTTMMAAVVHEFGKPLEIEERAGPGKLDRPLSGVLAHLQSEYALRSEQEYAQTPTA